jgi:hypothetical protein
MLGLKSFEAAQDTMAPLCKIRDRAGRIPDATAVESHIDDLFFALR